MALPFKTCTFVVRFVSSSQGISQQSSCLSMLCCPGTSSARMPLSSESSLFKGYQDLPWPGGIDFLTSRALLGACNGTGTNPWHDNSSSSRDISESHGTILGTR